MVPASAIGSAGPTTWAEARLSFAGAASADAVGISPAARAARERIRGTRKRFTAMIEDTAQPAIGFDAASSRPPAASRSVKAVTFSVSR